MNCRIHLLSFAFLSASIFCFAQPAEESKRFTHADTLRGSLNANRDWWDVLRYDIKVTPDISHKTISGFSSITFQAVRDGERMQIDLQPPMVVDSIEKGSFRQDGNVIMLDLASPVKKGTVEKITIYYHGKPTEPVNPPWGGGWVWKKDMNGRPWISAACQGDGASLWYPCKDHQSDEPDDGASLTIVVPDTLVAVGNGRLESRKTENGKTSYTWVVKNPINNYLIIPYIGKYVNFTDTLRGEKGVLDISYWVLDYNLEKAKEHFKQVKQMFRAFEYWFGPYPFYEDSYKLVDAPYLGMEHQSAVAYGNKYLNGYLGRDLSGSGWGLKWDYIIVHESGHEWFGNNITTKDIADSWVHEGITNYSEVLFTEYYYGKQAANEYCYGLRRSIGNKEPIISHYGVNEDGGRDMYPKGANLMHTIRHAINDDEKFRQILRGLNARFYHQTVTTGQIENYISEHAGFDFSKVFDQYLRTTQIPQLDIHVDSAAQSVSYRWDSCISGFNLPLVLLPDGPKIFPTQAWQKIALKKEELANCHPAEIEKLYYIRVSTDHSPDDKQ
jgi:aminopeptidase N